jgi:voltage-gated potassium channel
VIEEPAANRSLRRRVYLVLEGGQANLLGGLVEAFLIALILVNVAAYVAASVPDFRHAHREALELVESISVAIFTIEYALRLWTAIEDPTQRARGPASGRLHAAVHPLMLIDFFAIAPAYVALFVPFFDLRFLRLIRLFRLLKIARYSPALSTLGQVVADERRALFGTLLLLLFTMVFAASAMHAVEGTVQPRIFGTIPDAMWWAIATLTTVGYGDAVPITLAGRVVAGITMILGVGLFALPVGIVATGFVETIHRRDFVVTFGMLTRVPMFKDFDAQTVAELMTLLRAQSVRPGAILSGEGERAAAMYFVVAGEVEVQLPAGNLRFGAGDYFGELALLHETMRAATIVATRAARLLALSPDDFEKLLRHHPGLKSRIHAFAAKRAHEIAQAGGISQDEINAARAARGETLS